MLLSNGQVMNPKAPERLSYYDKSRGMVGKHSREREIKFFVHGFRKSSRYVYTVHPPLLFTVGSFTYNVDTSIFAIKVFVKSLLPHLPCSKLIFFS